MIPPPAVAMVEGGVPVGPFLTKKRQLPLGTRTQDVYRWREDMCVGSLVEEGSENLIKSTVEIPLLCDK